MISATRTRSTIEGVQFQTTCFACGADNPRGLQLKFRVDPDGTATATFVLGSEWEGSRGIVHGGIVTTLLDEAMTKAVAASGCKSITAELQCDFANMPKRGRDSRSGAGLSGIKRDSSRPKPRSLPQTAASAHMPGRNS